MLTLPFADRREAGRLLANELPARNPGGNAVVLGLARGGVPVASMVAERLRLALDVLVVRRIGVPWQPELAMGALAGSVCVLDNRLIRKLGMWDEDVAEIVSAEQQELERSESLYRRGAPAIDLRGRTAILVDDGMATGSTMLAAVRYVRSLGPARIIVAVPVGSHEACENLRREADEVVCLAIPEIFHTVARWLHDFPPVSDEDVERLLAESRQRMEIATLASKTAA